ncbi:unnamed protein product [Trichobilharzia szidati]|nr:unnamed protein product [Trichobilharzia szidati]
MTGYPSFTNPLVEHHSSAFSIPIPLNKSQSILKPSGVVQNSMGINQSNAYSNLTLLNNCPPVIHSNNNINNNRMQSTPSILKQDECPPLNWLIYSQLCNLMYSKMSNRVSYNSNNNNNNSCNSFNNYVNNHNDFLLKKQQQTTTPLITSSEYEKDKKFMNTFHNNSYFPTVDNKTNVCQNEISNTTILLLLTILIIF